MALQRHFKNEPIEYQQLSISNNTKTAQNGQLLFKIGCFLTFRLNGAAKWVNKIQISLRNDSKNPSFIETKQIGKA